MNDRFTELLAELGNILDLSLEPDPNGTCCLVAGERLMVQLELNRMQDKVVMGGYLGIVPPGKFRENMLAHALKSNALYPRVGSLGYTPYHNQLALFDFLPLEQLNGEKLADALALFLAKATEWSEALKTGILPPLVLPSELPKPSFPLK